MNWIKLVAYIVLTILTTLLLFFLFSIGYIITGGAAAAAAIDLGMLTIPFVTILGALFTFPIVIQYIIGSLIIRVALLSWIALAIVSHRYINKNNKIGYFGNKFMKIASIIVPGLGLPIFLEGRGWY